MELKIVQKLSAYQHDPQKLFEKNSRNNLIIRTLPRARHQSVSHFLDWRMNLREISSQNTTPVKQWNKYLV